ncbi:MAG: hypothetical protein IJ574_06040 [Bacilli bacterium]|nr:hypothetical protein [Bacilli bacterium]
MKSGKIIIASLLAVFLLTGCASKESKLTCTQTTSGVDVIFIVDFKGNVIDNMDINYNMDLSKYSDAQIEAVGKQDFCSSVKNAFGSYKEAFNNCKQNIADKKLEVTADLEIEKVSDSILDKLASPEAAKEELEDEGYTCTLETK